MYSKICNSSNNVSFDKHCSALKSTNIILRHFGSRHYNVYDLQNEVSHSLGVHLMLQIHPYSPYHGWGMKHPTKSKILRINLYSLINIFLKIPSVEGNATQTVFLAVRNYRFTYRHIVGLLALALALVELTMLCKLGVSLCWPSYTVPR